MDLCSCEEKENGELLCFVNSGNLENRAGDLRGFEAEWCGSGVFPRAVAIILAGKMRDSGKSERKQETFDKDSMGPLSI